MSNSATDSDQAGDTFGVFGRTDSSAALNAAEAIADGVAATLRVTRALVDSKRDVDLAGFDGMVGLLCARALDLPPEQGRVLQPRLAALLTELDELATALGVRP